MNAGLKKLVDNATAKLADKVSEITLNDASDAHNDLGELESVASNLRNGVFMDACADFGSEAVEPVTDALDELVEAIEELQREILDDLIDEEDEDAVMEFMEDKVADLETMIEELAA